MRTLPRGRVSEPHCGGFRWTHDVLFNDIIVGRATEVSVVDEDTCRGFVKLFDADPVTLLPDPDLPPVFADYLAIKGVRHGGSHRLVLRSDPELIYPDEEEPSAEWLTYWKQVLPNIVAW